MFVNYFLFTSMAKNANKTTTTVEFKLSEITR